MKSHHLAVQFGPLHSELFKGDAPFPRIVFRKSQRLFADHRAEWSEHVRVEALDQDALDRQGRVWHRFSPTKICTLWSIFDMMHEPEFGKGFLRAADAG